MGWKSFFKGKSSPAGRAEPRLRWFGKLPTYGDYHLSPGPEPWTLAFNDWLSRGGAVFVNRHRQAGHKVPRFPRSLMVLRLPQSDMTVLGYVDDYGGDMGGRPFPICFYVGTPTQRWPGPTGDTLGAAAVTFAQLSDLTHDLAHFFRMPGRLESVFGRRELDLGDLDKPHPDDRWQADLAEIPLAEWFERARPGLATAEPHRWLALLDRHGQMIADFARDEPDFNPTLRFPIVPGPSPISQTAGWLHWLGARLPLKERFLSLFIPLASESAGSSLTVIAREPDPEDFQLAGPLVDLPPSVDDLSRAVEKTPEGAAPASAESDPTSQPTEPASSSSPDAPTGSLLDLMLRS